MARLSLVPHHRVARLAQAGKPAKSMKTLTLLESGRSVSLMQVLQTSLGMLLHGSVVIGGLALATRAPLKGEVLDDTRRPLFFAPEPRPVSTAPAERLQYVGLAAGPVPVPASEPSADGDAGSRVEVPGMAQNVDPAELDEPAYEEFVLSEIEVDSTVVTDPESGGPDYPPELLAQNVEGAVAARFIVDSTGRVKPGSFVSLESTHPLFTKAVEDALPRMKFRPAYVGTKRVPQLVVQSFAFRISRGDTLLRDSTRDTLPGGAATRDTGKRIAP